MHAHLISRVLCFTPATPAVVASEKGVVVGRLTFTEDGDDIDCRRMGVGGKAIPPNISKVSVQRKLNLILVFSPDPTYKSNWSTKHRWPALPQAGCARRQACTGLHRPSCARMGTRCAGDQHPV